MWYGVTLSEMMYPIRSGLTENSRRYCVPQRRMSVCERRHNGVTYRDSYCQSLHSVHEPPHNALVGSAPKSPALPAFNVLAQGTQRLEPDTTARKAADVHLLLVLRAAQVLIQPTQRPEGLIAKIAFVKAVIFVVCHFGRVVASGCRASVGDKSRWVGDEVVLVILLDEHVQSVSVHA